MKDLTTDNLGEILASNKKVFIQYGASWCGACKVTKPKIHNLSEQYNEIEFYYVDAEKLPQTREFAEINNLPTFAGFVDGKLVKQVSGTKEENILGVINEVAGN